MMWRITLYMNIEMFANYLSMGATEVLIEVSCQYPSLKCVTCVLGATTPSDTMSENSSHYGSVQALDDDEHLVLHSSRLHGSSRSYSSPTIDRMRESAESGYEELFKDSVPCPSCRGLGRVPKGIYNL
jgi:hypothetical protein